MNTRTLVASLILSILSAVTAHASDLLLQEAQRERGLLKSSIYQHRTDVDEKVGRFNFDCSGFVDYALAHAAPEALTEVPISKPRELRPLAQDYYQVLTKTGKKRHWQRVARAIDLQPGDLVVWLIPEDSLTKDTGHVMIVAEAPAINPQAADQVLIPVIDSANSPHASDSRGKGDTGLGQGTIAILNESSTQAPIGFYWRANASKSVHKTPIVFGRLVP